VTVSHGTVLAGRLPTAHLALGGGGLGHWIVRLFIWHELFRLLRYLWRIPTVGPFLVVLLGLIIVGLLVWRQARGPRGPGGRWRGRPGGGGGQGPGGSGSGPGPRDW
jgi:hypothetical protein